MNPRVPPAKKKATRVSFALTDAEERVLIDTAHKAGLSVSKFVHATLFDKTLAKTKRFTSAARH